LYFRQQYAEIIIPDIRRKIVADDTGDLLLTAAVGNAGFQ
jgi:hypothetical protein